MRNGIFFSSITACLLFALSGCSGSKKTAGFTPGPVKVGVITMCPKTLPVIATTDAIAKAGTYNIKVQNTQPNLKLEKIRVKNDDAVKKDQVLFELSDDGLSKQKLDAAIVNYKKALTTYNAELQLPKNSVSAINLQQAKAAVLTAQQQQTMAQQQFDFLQVKAPVDGKIEDIPASLAKGQTVEPQAMLGVVFSSDMRVDYKLPGKWIYHAANDQKVRVYRDDQQVANGAVATVSHRLTDNFFDVTARVQGDKALVPGEWLTVKQDIMSRKGVYLVPSLAVVPDGQSDSVFVVAAKKTKDNHSSVIAQQIQVSVGNEKRGDMEEILSGLRPGDKVIVAGASQLQDQSPIKVVTTKGCE